MQIKKLKYIVLAIIGAVILADIYVVCNTKRSWKFISIPDFYNNDIDFPDSRVDDTIDFVLNAISKEHPDFVVVPGDLVMGRWYAKKDPASGKLRFAALEHMKEKAGRYYLSWIKRMDEHGLKYYPVMGDHDIGDNPWPYPKIRYVPEMVSQFVGHFGLESPTYYVVHNETLLIMLNVFEKHSRSIKVGVSDSSMKYLQDIVDKYQDVRHKIIIGHVPVLMDPRILGHMSFDEERVPGFLDFMKENKVDLYLCGEIHRINVVKKDGFYQVANGSNFLRQNNINYLIVELEKNRISLQIKKIETEVSGKEDFNNELNPLNKKSVKIPAAQKKKGFVSVGKMIISKSMTGSRKIKLQGCFKSDLYDFDENRSPY
ncbi:metallophosphoesterase family protein [Elusimicrobiota bacterium]